MKFIEPNVEYWQQGAGIEGVWNQIARATRVCYQSKPREGESSEDFVKRIILKPALVEGSLDNLEHCKFDFDKMHGAMLEHGTVLISLPHNEIDEPNFKKVIKSKYSKYNYIKEFKCIYITTNMRVIIENDAGNILQYMTDYLSPSNSKFHPKRYTFSVITDIGVTREMNRHRKFSVAEQSTRYCDFNKDKFGEELTFIKPAWLTQDDINFKDDNNIMAYLSTNQEIEDTYKYLRINGWKPEQARQVLPLGLKTQAVYTAFADDWKHFLRLRADNVSGKAHPNIQLVAKKIKDIIENFK